MTQQPLFEQELDRHKVKNMYDITVIRYDKIQSALKKSVEELKMMVCTEHWGRGYCQKEQCHNCKSIEQIFGGLK